MTLTGATACRFSRRFDDPFYSLQDGLAEARHVFLGGNDLPQRFRDGFHVAELGFGTGLNFAATALAWQQAGVTRGGCSSRASRRFPWPWKMYGRRWATSPRRLPFASTIEAALDGRACVDDLGITLSVEVGDARQTVPAWEGRADAWFLDGFAPARNPELWEEALMQAVAARTAAGRHLRHLFGRRCRAPRARCRGLRGGNGVPASVASAI